MANKFQATHALQTAQDVFPNFQGGSFGAGFNRRVSGETYGGCFKYDSERTDRDLHAGWDAAEKLIAQGRIYYIHNFHASHGGCERGFAFQYGGKWVCNACGNEGVNKPWWAIKVQKDGNAWMCCGLGFENLQESDNYAFGETPEQAIENYGALMAATSKATA